jgi:GATA-binding protein, other eukaryote
MADRPTRAHCIAGDEPRTHTDTDASAGRKCTECPRDEHPFLRFPSLFSSDFGPSALLSVQPTVSNAMNYGEGIINTSSRGFSILCPTIELPLDEILSNVDPNDDDFAASFNDSIPPDFDVLMQEPAIPAFSVAESQPVPHGNNEPDPASFPPSQPVQEPPPQTISPAKLGPSGGTRANAPGSRPNLNLTAVKTQNAPTTQARPGATATSVNDLAVLRRNGHSAQAGGSRPNVRTVALHTHPFQVGAVVSTTSSTVMHAACIASWYVIPRSHKYNETTHGPL